MVQLIPMIISLPLIGFWFWMFRDMTNNEYLSSDARYNWTLAFIFLNFFGALWYYFVEYRNRYL
jgi:hypothetical protein